MSDAPTVRPKMLHTAPRHSPGPREDSQSHQQSRLRILDGLRPLAAMMVLAYHFITLRDGWGQDPSAFSTPVYHLSEYGYLGVEVFFLISGFVICMSAWGRSLGDFIASRVSRLYPAYWAAILLTVTVLTVYPKVRGPGGWETILTNFTMLQQGLDVPNVDDSYWTLFIELKFYVLFAIIIFAGVTYRRCVMFCGIWTVAGVASLKAHDGLLSFWAIAPYSPYFIAGIAFYLMHRFRPTALLWAIVMVSFALAQHYVQGRLKMNLGDKAEWTASWQARVIILLAFVIMAGISLGWFDAVQWRWLTISGSITYPLYLLHMYIGFTLIALLRDRLPAPAVLLITVAALLALSWAVYRYVERPLGRRMRSALTRSMQEIRYSS
ncbi:acyltransferase [Streptomyces sp. NBRC 13847]|uniref:acyltransferase family protein n=2 Tax=Streptomyces TaxID=1883 RepID=UPI0024A3B37C|nr:acyltransferase [Streptomyces sp. NBRC 13847]GLW18658.1 acyltransferase [Streptomyces sp. NBRC 13847]